jgi:hypothetical protein
VLDLPDRKLEALASQVQQRTLALLLAATTGRGSSPPAAGLPAAVQVTATRGCVHFIVTATGLGRLTLAGARVRPAARRSAGAAADTAAPAGGAVLPAFEERELAELLLSEELVGAAEEVLVQAPGSSGRGGQGAGPEAAAAHGAADGTDEDGETAASRSKVQAQMPVVATSDAAPLLAVTDVTPAALAWPGESGASGASGLISSTSSTGSVPGRTVVLQVVGPDGSGSARELPGDLQVVASCDGQVLFAGAPTLLPSGRLALHLPLPLPAAAAAGSSAGEPPSRVVQLLLASNASAALYSSPLQLLLAPRAVVSELEEASEASRLAQLQGLPVPAGAGGAGCCLGASQLLQDAGGLVLLLEAWGQLQQELLPGAGAELAASFSAVAAELLAQGLYETASWLLSRWQAAGLSVISDVAGSDGKAASAATLRQAMGAATAAPALERKAVGLEESRVAARSDLPSSMVGAAGGKAIGGTFPSAPEGAASSQQQRRQPLAARGAGGGGVAMEGPLPALLALSFLPPLAVLLRMASRSGLLAAPAASAVLQLAVLALLLPAALLLLRHSQASAARRAGGVEQAPARGVAAVSGAALQQAAAPSGGQAAVALEAAGAAAQALQPQQAPPAAAEEAVPWEGQGQGLPVTAGETAAAEAPPPPASTITSPSAASSRRRRRSWAASNRGEGSAAAAASAAAISAGPQRQLAAGGQQQYAAGQARHRRLSWTSLTPPGSGSTDLMSAAASDAGEAALLQGQLPLAAPAPALAGAAAAAGAQKGPPPAACWLAEEMTGAPPHLPPVRSTARQRRASWAGPPAAAAAAELRASPAATPPGRWAREAEGAEPGSSGAGSRRGRRRSLSSPALAPAGYAAALLAGGGVAQQELRGAAGAAGAPAAGAGRLGRRASSRY